MNSQMERHPAQDEERRVERFGEDGKTIMQKARTRSAGPLPGRVGAEQKARLETEGWGL